MDSSTTPRRSCSTSTRSPTGHAYFRLGAFEVSPDHRLLAYSADTSGAESFTPVREGPGDGRAAGGDASSTSRPAWRGPTTAAPCSTSCSTRRAAPAASTATALGANSAEDALVHYEADESFFLDIARTRSNAFLLLELASHSTSEVRFVSADRPEEPFRTLEPRRAGVEYTVSHHGDRFFITTNDAAPNFRLVSAPVTDPSRAHWTEILPHRPDVKLDSTDAFRQHLVVYEREAGLRQIRVLDLATRAPTHLVAFPEPVYTVRQHENPEFDTTLLRFTYTSMVTPASVVDYDMAARTWTVRKQTEVLGGYDPARYRTERLFATAPDGTRVPISLVYQLPLERPGGPRPAAAQRLRRLRRQLRPVVLVQQPEPARPRLRGGHRPRPRRRGDGPRRGTRAASCSTSRTRFTDFIAAAEHLVAEGFTAPDRLAISGGSAGGLLMGAVTNLRPDLFRAVLAEVPFVDVVNTMLDATAAAHGDRVRRVGQPERPGVLRCIRSYSPYDNVRAQAYPHMLVTAGLNDPAGGLLGAGQVHRPAPGARRPTPTGCCSGPTWARVTAGRRGGGTSCGRWPSSTRSCWMCWGFRSRRFPEVARVRSTPRFGFTAEARGIEGFPRQEGTLDPDNANKLVVAPLTDALGAPAPSVPSRASVVKHQPDQPRPHAKTSSPATLP